MREIISKPAGIYIHIPFCKAKCGYCDFYSITDLGSQQSFIAALLSEINQVARELHPEAIFDTVYLGGGTPSLLTPDELDQILNTINDNFRLAEDTEITLEANPGALTAGKLKNYRESGVNRLSIGIQSFSDAELRMLERIHTADDAVQIVEDARQAGFDNLSLDLIFALPGQTLSRWKNNLQKAIELSPEHISAYNLIFEEGTPFYQAREAGRFKSKSETEELKFYQMTIETLVASRYIHYEVSNFARSEKLYSRHNRKYWDHTGYLGFGPSAHSYWKDDRWSNVSSVHDYIQSAADGKLPVNFREHIGPETREFETIFLSLRTITGLNLLEYKTRFQQDFTEKYKEKVDRLVESGLAEFKEHHFCLTQKGLFISDAILTEFVHS